MERYKLCVGVRGPASLVTSSGRAARLHDVIEYTIHIYGARLSADDGA